MKAVKVIIAFILFIGILGFILYRTLIAPQLAFAEVATAFAAKKACSCVYVVGRSLEACERDFTDDVSMAQFSADGQSVSVEVLGGRISARAVYTPDLGCALLPAANQSL